LYHPKLSLEKNTIVREIGHRDSGVTGSKETQSEILHLIDQYASVSRAGVPCDRMMFQL
jgi:hypothetical protein